MSGHGAIGDEIIQGKRGNRGDDQRGIKHIGEQTGQFVCTHLGNEPPAPCPKTAEDQAEQAENLKDNGHVT